MISKRPTITTNEGAEQKYVQITCNVYTNPDSLTPVTISPYKFDISQFGEKTRNSLEFTMNNSSATDLDCKLIDMPYNMFKISLPKKIKAGKSEKGKIEVVSDQLKNEFEKSVTFEFSDGANNTRYTIPVKRTVRIPGQASAQPAAAGSGKH